MVPTKKFAPSLIPKRGKPLRRIDDVGEENSLEFSGKTTSLSDVTLKKTPMKGLGFLSRSGAEFLAQ